jgi:membrane peptidoglycan carboxypeptidase
VRRVISQKASIETSRILQSVVQNGHGKKAGVPGYLVGGKTGTAQVVDPEAGKYAEGKFVGSFAGFAPIDDPKFTIVVELNNPKNVEWAESSAGPAFGELMKFLLEYYNIEPTEEYTQEDLDRFNATHTILKFSEEDKKEEEAAADASVVPQDQGEIIKKDIKKKKNDKR